jgi:DUF1680 family protein
VKASSELADDHQDEMGVQLMERTRPMKDLYAATQIAITLALTGVASAAETLEPVRLQTVRLGGFWREQVVLMTAKWIPHCMRQMEAGGEGEELLNLVATGEVLAGKPPSVAFKGCAWSDAYIYNTLEAACLALEVDPAGDAELVRAQAFLRAKMEAWIPVILAAQDKDGYIHSFHVLNKRPHFTRISDHEFYVMGYLIEMGIAHARLTGGRDRRLYDAALRCANHLCDVFGAPPKRSWKNGHPGLEHALCRLGEMANETEGAGKGAPYIALAKHFVDHQHELHPNVYDQSEQPAVKMTEARGHAVRATYFYTALADLARLTGDTAYQDAAGRIWDNAVNRKHYLTGGVGASHQGEAFGADYELPNNGYCESCASCGLSFWAEQMHRLHADARYIDVQERALYNNIAGAVARDGATFYYQNPPASKQPRHPWHVCPCCVGNIPRAFIAIKDLMYSVSAGRDILFVNHYGDSAGVINAVGGGLRVRQETRYPWAGEVALTLTPASPAAFTLALRIPDRAESDLYAVQPPDGEIRLTVNGQAQPVDTQKGFARIRRTWQAGDRVELVLPMPVQRVHCDERVVANRGRVAVQRGPIVYSFEDVDHARPVRSAVLPPEAELTALWRGELLGGVMTVKAGGLQGVPNFARLNRGGFSQVWMLEDPAKAGVNTLSALMDLTVSFCRGNGMDPVAANDGVVPQDATQRVPNFDFWPHKGTAEWLQYTFDNPTEVKTCTVWWFDDTGRGECRLPESWRLSYQTQDGAWRPVEGAPAYSVSTEKPSVVAFTPVTATAVRLDVQLRAGFSAGVYEWAVQ